MTTTIDPVRRDAARRALLLTDPVLMLECEESFFVASGPGGQHRNKTESGVRLTHRPTALSVTATERRSQFQNRAVALERLRAALGVLTYVPKPRRKTRPSRGAKQRRLEDKKKAGDKKAQRRRDTWP